MSAEETNCLKCGRVGNDSPCQEHGEEAAREHRRAYLAVLTSCARADGRAMERAAIVSYLRDQGESCNDDVMGFALDCAADEIEDGTHAK